MDLLVHALLALLTVVAVLALVAVLVPFHVRARGTFREDLVGGDATIAWGFGLLSVVVTPEDGANLRVVGVPVAHLRSSTPKEARSARRRAPRGWRGPSARVTWRIARRTLQSLRVRAHLKGRIGTGDPANTAALAGVLAATQKLAPTLDTAGVRVDWVDAAIDLDGDVTGWIWPAALVWIVASEWAQDRWSPPPRGRSNHEGRRETV